jgi:hypothetical protein
LFSAVTDLETVEGGSALEIELAAGMFSNTDSVIFLRDLSSPLR